MKKLLSILIITALLFSFAACGNTKTDSDLKEITLCLDWTPNTNHTGFFVADKLGYYEEEGIKISIVQPPEDGAELMTASGQAQFGISFQDSLAPLFASAEPMGVTAVCAIVNHNTSGIISRKGEGADRPKGLEGKRYSTWNGPVELAIVKEVTENDGGDYSKIELIPNIVTNEAEALRNKDTDAIWIFYAWAGIACETAELDFDYFDFIDIDPVFDYYTPVIIGNNEFLAENPDLAKAFLRATKKGYEYAIENPEAAASILIKGDTTGSLLGSEELVTQSQKWISEQYISDGEAFGVFDADRWNNFYSWLWKKGLTEKEIPENFGFTNDYIKVD
ncbi:MAG: ABC transporter substrate-binding protein [Acutalibacteraceae bacterium]|nr:ABC transporter substrate-binding protein [Acutalibacteraceae bacterium]